MPYHLSPTRRTFATSVAARLLLSLTLTATGLAQAPSAPVAIDLGPHNLAIARVPDGWQADPQFHKADASIVYAASHRLQESLLLISATAIGIDHQPTPDMMADEVLANYAATSEVRSSERSPKSVAGINGVRIAIRATNAGRKISVIGWVGAHNGREYRIAVVSPGSEAGAVLMLNDWLGQVRLVDPSAKVTGDDLPAPAPYTSARFGYSIAPPAKAGWKAAAPEIAGIPDVEYLASIGGHTFVAVQPLYLGTDVDPEDAARGMLQYTSSPWDAAKVKTPWDFGNGFKGFHVAADAGGKEQPWSFRSVVARGRHCAFLVIGWTSRKDQILNIDAALRTLNLTSVPAPGQPKAPTHAIKTVDGLFQNRTVVPDTSVSGMAQNEIGLLTLARGDFLGAAEVFRAALDERLDPTICFNLLRALLEAQEVTPALQFGSLAIKQFPNHDQLASEMAVVYELTRQPEKAIDIYRVLFPDRLHDDERFARFIDMLVDRHDTDLAKRHIAAYRKHTDNDLVASLEADVLVEMNEPAKAAELLRKRITSRMPHDRLLMSYCGALVKAERTDEAIRQLEKLESENGASVTLHAIRGHTYLMDGQPEKAKLAYEAALKLKPNDPELKQYALSASAYVGQGNNSALNTPIDAVSLPNIFLQKDSADLDDSAGAGYRIYAKASHFEAGKKQKTTLYQVIEIYDQNGVDAFNMLTLDLEPLSERLYVNTLEVLDESGKVIEKGKPETYYVQDHAKDGVASFRQVAKLPVPGLRPGCTIRLIATREDRTVGDVFRFNEEWLGRYYPTAVSVYRVSGDVSRLKSVELNGVEKTVDRDAITWSVRNPQRLYYEPLMPPPNTFVPCVAVADAGSTWEAEAATYLSMIAPRLEPSTAVKKELASLGIDGLNPSQKLRAIVDHVDKKFTYTALAFGPRARMPTDPADIISNRYGDCKDMSLLTHLLLREAGVKSNLAVVRASGSTTPELPSLDQFDHMIVNVPDCDGNWWIDCTGDNTDPIMPTPPPIYLEGRDALVLDAENSRLVRLPDWDAATSNVNIERTVKLQVDGQMTVSDKVEMNGAIAHYYRSSIRAAEAMRREATIVALCALESNEVRDFTATADGVDDYLKPLSMRVDYTPRQKLRAAGSRLVGELPSALERQLLAPDLIKDRQTPMCVQMGMHVKVKLALDLPPGMALEGMDAGPQVMDGPFGKGEIRFTRASTGITAELNLQSPPVTAPASDYEKFCEWRQSVIDTWSIPLIVTQTK